MLTASANRIGVDVHAYRPSESSDRSPGNQLTTASLDDIDALKAFAATVDVVTIETENIPVDTLRMLEEIVPVRPASRVVEIVQDRLFEKQFLQRSGVPVADYGVVDSAADLAREIERLGGTGILKTRRFGYDGKGQSRIGPGDDAETVWSDHGSAPSVVESFVSFDCEISVIAARSQTGDVAMFDPGKNAHREGILRETYVPSGLDPAIEDAARDIAQRILESHDYVGVLGVEFFVVGNDLLVNEMAPRVHNSGHWTQAGCAVDQFEQHVRAVMGMPLGSAERHSDVVMTNLIGNDIDDLDQHLATSNARVHLYGKRETRPGRKMGHVNTIL